MAASASAQTDEERLVIEGRDIEHQRREWAAQRVAWVVMLLLVLAALLGLLGAPGLFGTVTTAAPDGSIEVEHDRITRYHAPTELAIEVAPDFVQDGEVRLRLDAGFAAGFTVQSMSPEPESTELDPGGVIYVFPVSEPGEPLRITFHIEHDTYWRAEAAMGLVNGEQIEFSQIVLP